VTVQANGAISVSYRGYGPGNGPGVGGSGGWGGGGGYGGAGGDGNGGSGGGATYGSVEQPVDLGSGGWDGAGRAGGALRLIVGGTLRVDGIISANGSDSFNYGGSSGGSLWLTASNFDGAGLLQANGGYGGRDGASNSGGGGGGGGRIAVYF